MVRKTRQIIITGIMLSTLCIMLGVQAANVVLTEEVVTRYEATQPEIQDLTKKLTELEKMSESDDKTAKISEIVAKRTEVVGSKGWADFWEYMDARSRITEVLIPLMVLEKFEHQQVENIKKAQETVLNQLKKKDFSREEIKVVIKHFQVLKKLHETAVNR